MSRQSGKHEDRGKRHSRTSSKSSRNRDTSQCDSGLEDNDTTSDLEDIHNNRSNSEYYGERPEPEGCSGKEANKSTKDKTSSSFLSETSQNKRDKRSKKKHQSEEDGYVGASNQKQSGDKNQEVYASHGKLSRENSRSQERDKDELEQEKESKAKRTNEQTGKKKDKDSTQHAIIHNDEAVDIEERGGRSGQKIVRQGSSKAELDLPPRLLVVSSKIKNSSLMSNAVMANVTFVHFKYESSTLDGLLGSIAQHLGSRKVESIGLILHGSPTVINITGKDEKVVTKENILEQHSIRDFFTTLVKNHLDKTWVNARLDILACNAAQNVDGGLIAREIEAMVEVPVGISKDLTGTDIPLQRLGEENISCIADLYFKMEKLRNWSGHNQQTLAGFEKIRTVGKGAYGIAVLYRKKDDDSLVILKEINLHDLNASERQLALNEVRVLAMLDHPNIISYYDSFEEDGTVMIEMEYADGGTLAQFLSQQDKPLEEKEILVTFQQLVAAMKHIHEHNILHRDLKTANIFLTKEGVIKVGDFGISKLMTTTNKGANTVLGTPYYISPEMCEGKPYNDKSDIWALGCILYEMACLQKTFEGSNLPALVNKIMKGQFAPVKGNYSQEFKFLIRDMLQREPEYRPSAKTIWHDRLPELVCRYEDPVTDIDDELLASHENSGMGKNKRTSANMLEKRSVLYYFDLCAMEPDPIVLPSKVKIRNVAVGEDHVIVVTVERMVFTWGEGSKGQLGHGTLEAVVRPQQVEALKGKSITKACCGDGFSAFASDNGIVMTCGEGKFGCLGHGDWCSTSRPRLIEALLSVDVVAMASGPHHVVAVGSDGEVFSWGKGADGRLGLNSEEDKCQPQEVTLTDSAFVRDVKCGQDGTMLITDVGSVLACGNNEYNKLGLNQRQGFLMAMKNIFNKTEVEGQKVFTLVKALARHRVIDVSLGPTHSAVIVEPGHVYTFGKNTEGQLGTKDCKQQNAPIEVKIFEEKAALRVQCGEFYSVAGTVENDLLFWGTHFKKPPKLDDSLNRGNSRKDTNSAGTQRQSHSSVTSLKDMEREGSAGARSVDKYDKAALQKNPERQVSSDSVFSTNGDKMNASSNSGSSIGGFRPLSSTPRRSTSASSRDKEKDAVLKDDAEIIFNPTPLLKLDSSGSLSQSGETVTLANFFCHGENLFVQVETTAPPPKRKKTRKRIFRKRPSDYTLDVPSAAKVQTSASSRDGGDEYSSEASEIDTMGTIPAWIKQELANSERENYDGNEPDDTSDHSDDDTTPGLESSFSSIQINRNLKQGSKTSTANRVTSVGAHGHVATSNVHRIGVKPANEDGLSTSSSSEAMPQTFRDGASDNTKQRTGAVPRKPVLSSARKVQAPGPMKSKHGPQQSQKPLTRIRAQNKARNRNSQEETQVSHVQSSVEEMKVKEDHISQLQSEVERMREEKRKTEERLQRIEEEHRKQQELLKKETEMKTKEKENELKHEIVNLRKELLQQGNRLENNNEVVQSLQEKLVQIQTQQLKMSVQQAQPRQQPAQSTKESRICSIQ